jgi:hypothetical protein
LGVGSSATTALLVLAAVVGCGRRGPPQTPFVLVPAAPTLEPLRRVGEDIFIPVVVPAANLDNSKPAAVTRIDIFGVTAMTPPARARVLEIASLVASIPVAPAGEPGDTVVPAPDPTKGVLQGARAMVRDTLSSDEFTPRELPALADAPRPVATPAAAAAAAAAAPPPPSVLRRFYIAFAYNGRNRPGPPSALLELPLTVLPPPPDDLLLFQSPGAIIAEWAPAGGLLGWLLDRALPPEPDPLPADARAATAKPPPAPTDWLPGPSLYNVYRDVSADPFAPPAAAAPPAWQVGVAAALNPAPLGVLRFEDPVAADDRERCYYVRSVRGGVEGPPSPRRCVRMIDMFPPAVPTNVAAIVSEGAINLIWEPNVDEDLGGYTVLRSADGGATLLTLTPTPIAEPRFTDRGVRPGVTYVYEVRAVDSRVPVPNTSEPARVTETAR